MRRHISLLLLAWAAGILLSLNPAFAAPGDAKIFAKKFEVLIKTARAGDASAAMELAKISRKPEDVAKVDDAVLGDLASFLDSSSEPVRGWAAAAIGLRAQGRIICAPAAKNRIGRQLQHDGN